MLHDITEGHLRVAEHAGGRPSWDETWMLVARAMAARSLCPNGAGCVIVDQDNHVVSVGYAGPDISVDTRGWKTCATICQRAMKNQEAKHPGYEDCPSIHAEQNALIHADWGRLNGGVCYVTRKPCHACTKMLCNTRLDRIAWSK